jgi:hypothetical protein
MPVLKAKFSFSELDLFLTQQDTLTALIIWIVLEALSLIMLPNFQLIPGENKQLTWILISGPSGVLGAILIGFSSSVLQYCHDRLPRRSAHKKTYIGLAQLGSWLGLAGISFPLVMAAVEFWVLFTHGIASS